jgi:hypothetical protein
MTTRELWDEFMDRVIAAQRDIIKRGWSPYEHRVVVNPQYHRDLMASAARIRAYTSHIDFDVRGEMPYGHITLRHEVRAWPT